MDKWERKFNKYVKSKKHIYNCIAYSEGQECCLEKPWIKKFIRKLLEDSEREKEKCKKQQLSG